MVEKYVKQFKIGSGTFGEAYLVMSLCSEKSYVMKEVRVSDLSVDELEKTQREATVLARCKHINIIRYKENFLTQNPLTMCLVMEYADGGDLNEKVVEAKVLGKYIPESHILHWFIQIIFAVQYLHSNNILHRDLKSQNIFLTHNNIVKVGDFGIARFLRNKQDLATTAIGTPYYLSPEICLRKPYNHRSDMWAVGCILYELCSLNHPFEASDFETLVMKILHGIYVPFSHNYSRLLHDITGVLLRTNPAKRPTADEILIIPSLRAIVQDYIKRHERLISSVSRKSSSTTTAEVFTNNECQNGSTKEDENGEDDVFVQNNTSKVGGVKRKDTVDLRCTPSRGTNVRRNRQTQTPPDWENKNLKKIRKNSQIEKYSISPAYLDGIDNLDFLDRKPVFGETFVQSPCKTCPK